MSTLEDDLGISLSEPVAPIPVAAPTIAPVAPGLDRYVVIDTEGSGLFDFKQPADAPGQPRLAELTMLFVAPDLTIEREYHAYVRPDGWEMSPGATAVNKLTTEFLRENGIPVKDVLVEYQRTIVNEARVVVAHNAQHDLKQIRAELRRAGLDDLFQITRNICTMRGLTDVCRIPPNSGRGGYKFPKLSEALVYFHFDDLGDHTATGDAHGCLQLFRKMYELGILPEARVHFAKNKE
jgi:DNA polymerase III subunit epsilon